MRWFLGETQCTVLQIQFGTYWRKPLGLICNSEIWAKIDKWSNSYYSVIPATSILVGITLCFGINGDQFWLLGGSNKGYWQVKKVCLRFQISKNLPLTETSKYSVCLFTYIILFFDRRHLDQPSHHDINGWWVLSTEEGYSVHIHRLL